VLVGWSVEQADFGRLAFALTIATFFGVASDFGMPSLTVRDIAQDRSRVPLYYRNAITIKLIFSLIAFALVIAFMHLLNYPLETRRVVYPITAFMFIASLGSYHYFLFRGMERMDLDAVASLIHNALLIICVGVMMLPAVHTRPMHVSRVTTGYLAAGIISTSLLIILFNRRLGGIRLSFDFAAWKTLLKRSYYFAFYGFLGLIYMQIDTVMLSLTKTLDNPQTEIAIYQAPVKMLNVAIMMVSVLIGAYTPVLSRRFLGPREDFKALVHTLNRIGVTIVAPITAFCFAFSDRIMAFLFPPEYAASAPILMVLGIGFLVWFGPPYGIVFTAMNKQQINFIVAAICAAANIVLNLIFIPRYGALAAAATTLATYLLMKAFYLYYIGKHLDSILINRRYIYTLVLCAVIAAGLRFVNLHVIVSGAVFVLAYGAAAYTFVLTESERVLCRRMLKREERREVPA